MQKIAKSATAVHYLRIVNRWLIACVMAGATVPATAALITLDWGTSKPEPGEQGGSSYHFGQGGEKGFHWRNTVEKDPDGSGYVEGHWDIGWCGDVGLCHPDPELPPLDYDGSNFLGTDPSKCRRVEEDGTPIGPINDRGYPIGEDNEVPVCGTPLKLSRGGLPFDVVSFIALGSGIYSSKGGYAEGVFGELFYLDGDLWKGVDWIVIEGCGCGAPAGIDDLTLQIPEPAIAALLGAMGLVGVFSRRRVYRKT